AGIALNYTRTDRNDVGGGQGGGSVYNNLLQTPRDIDVVAASDLSNPYNAYGFTDANGVVHDDLYGYYGAYSMNPYWVLQYYNNYNDVDRIMCNFNVAYKPLEWLTVVERVGLDSYTDRRREESPKFNLNPADNTSGEYSLGNDQTENG